MKMPLSLPSFAVARRCGHPPSRCCVCTCTAGSSAFGAIYVYLQVDMCTLPFSLSAISSFVCLARSLEAHLASENVYGIVDACRRSVEGLGYELDESRRRFVVAELRHELLLQVPNVLAIMEFR